MSLKKLKRLNLLGLRVRVKYSSNLNLEGIEGIVIDETKNMLILKRDDGKVRKIPKNVCVFEIFNRNKRYLVNGSLLVGKIEKRLAEK